MSDGVAIAGVLLVAGPLLGAVPVAHPGLIPVWSAAREDQLAIVGAHRRLWSALNLGFGGATIATTAGLAILTGALDGDAVRWAGLLAATVLYGFGGVLWCAVLAVRARTTPALADLVAAGTDTEPAETLLAAATGGLFAGFVLATATALVVLGLTLLIAGGVAVPVAALTVGFGVIVAAWLVATGDLIPAVLYLPTLVIGIALLAGW